jgi:hypothetical protein
VQATLRGSEPDAVVHHGRFARRTLIRPRAQFVLELLETAESF